MGLFNRKRDDDVIDLAAHYKRKQAELEKRKSLENPSPAPSKVETYDQPQSSFSFLSSLASSQNSSPAVYSESSDNEEGSPDEKRKKLAKRLIDMTDRIEDLSNQIYHLQQRVDVLERRSHHQT